MVNCLEIPGATTEEELTWLAKQATKRKCIVEIGSYLGRSTIALAYSGATVYAVDDFIGIPIVHPCNEAWEREQLQKQFLENVKDFPNVKLIKCKHEDFVPPPETDMVFIDGSHDYESVKRDIEKFLKFKNILICGHDYHWWPDVKRVVDKIFGDRVKIAPYNVWYVEQ